MHFAKRSFEKILCKFPLAYAHLRTLCGAKDWEKQTFLKTIRPGWTIVEIVRSQKQGGEYSSATCYEELSRIMEAKHHTFQCMSIERKELKGRSIEDADLVPDPMKLRNFICEKVLI